MHALLSQIFFDLMACTLLLFNISLSVSVCVSVCLWIFLPLFLSFFLSFFLPLSLSLLVCHKRQLLIKHRDKEIGGRAQAWSHKERHSQEYFSGPFVLYFVVVASFDWSNRCREDLLNNHSVTAMRIPTHDIHVFFLYSLCLSVSPVSVSVFRLCLSPSSLAAVLTGQQILRSEIFCFLLKPLLLFAHCRQFSGLHVFVASLVSGSGGSNSCW